MPQLDIYHDAVKQALVKDGWTITHDPLVIKYKGLRLFVDLAAEKSFDEKPLDDSLSPTVTRVAIEVKVFGGTGFVNEFEKAVGQFILYRDMIERTLVRRELYLAVPQQIYEDSFLKPAIQEFTKDQRMPRCLRRG